MDTILDIQIRNEVIHNYTTQLINRFFKILPMFENDETSRNVYMKSLQSEMLGFNDLIINTQGDATPVVLSGILQYLISNPATPIRDVKREVFRAISIIERFDKTYAGTERIK